MAKTTDEKTRKRLERELGIVNQAIEALKKEPRDEELQALGDNTPLSEEVDAALSTEEWELRVERLSRLLDRAAALDEALHRLDAGIYGICIACDDSIFHNRLRAIPEAVLCARCQEEAERSHHHEIHAHEWKLARETYRERREGDEGDSAAVPGAIGTELD